CGAKAEARGGNAAEQVVFVVDEVGLLVLRRAYCDHERHQVILLRMRLPGGGRFFPMEQAVYSLLRIRSNQRLLQPLVEGAGRMPGARAKRPEVVIAEAAAADQHPFIAPWCKRSSEAHT